MKTVIQSTGLSCKQVIAFIRNKTGSSEVPDTVANLSGAGLEFSQRRVVFVGDRINLVNQCIVTAA